jgi:hypothetical protein
MPSSAVTRLRAWLHDGWIAVGTALVVLLVLEFAYRGLQRVRHEPDGEEERLVTPGHPYFGQAWYVELKAGLAARKNHLDPYRAHWPGPLSSRYVNIDSAGRRWTPQAVPDTGSVRHVVMLGGSVMWGFTARDSFTIPALTAARLSALGIRNARVDNLAQGAFNATQAATTLMLEVAHGRVPDVVVVLDGYNDIATALSYKEPGHTYNEQNSMRLIELGRRGFRAELLGLGRHSHLIEGLRSKLTRGGGSVDAPPVKLTALCGATGRYYAGVAHELEAIGRSSGFPVVFFQQPVHTTSGKVLSPWERNFPNRRGVKECSDSIDAAMAGRLGVSYFPLRDVFNADTASRFVDEISHLTESANAEVAERIVAVIAPMLRSGMQAGHTAPDVKKAP